MITINKCSDLSCNEIKEQIMIRKKLVATMVGSLYPQIVKDEIKQLEVIYNAK